MARPGLRPESPPQGGSGAGIPAPVVLVLAAGMEAAERARAEVGAAGCHVMASCSPAMALDWLSDHEGFFACVVVEPELSGTRALADLLEGARDAGLGVPFLIRTAFPAGEAACGGGLPARAIAAGRRALHAALRGLLPAAGSRCQPGTRVEGGP